MEYLRERVQEWEAKDQQQKHKLEEESRQRFHPCAGKTTMHLARVLDGIASLGSIALLGALGMINHALFWKRSILIVFVVQCIPTLLMSRGWMAMLFLTDGDLFDQDDLYPIRRCGTCLQCQMLL